jgi:hypothetical protein
MNGQLSYTFGPRRFRAPTFSRSTVRIIGVTRDSAGAILAGATVKLYRTQSDEYLAQTISDGSGNFSLDVPGPSPFYLVAYLPGSPDVAGATVNTLVPV